MLVQKRLASIYSVCTLKEPIVGESVRIWEPRALKNGAQDIGNQIHSSWFPWHGKNLAQVRIWLQIGGKVHWLVNNCPFTWNSIFSKKIISKSFKLLKILLPWVKRGGDRFIYPCLARKLVWTIHRIQCFHCIDLPCPSNQVCPPECLKLLLRLWFTMANYYTILRQKKYVRNNKNIPCLVDKTALDSSRKCSTMGSTISSSTRVNRFSDVLNFLGNNTGSLRSLPFLSPPEQNTSSCDFKGSLVTLYQPSLLTIRRLFSSLHERWDDVSCEALCPIYLLSRFFLLLCFHGSLRSTFRF